MKKQRRKQRGRKSPRLDTPLQNGLAAGGPVAPAVEEESVLPTEPVDIEIPPDTAFDPVELESGAIEQMLPDGDILIDLDPDPEPLESQDHYENLAERLDDITLGIIANEVIEGYESDERSRAQWLQDRERGLDLLALKVEEPKAISGNNGTVSSVRNPVLLESILRFQANARGELLPTQGPVKVRDDGPDTAESSQQARDLEDLLNHYLTTTACEYYDDTDQLLFQVGFSGMGFKKVYTCPIRMRPVSESVDAKDLIVSNTAVNLRSAERITHRITMSRSWMAKLQYDGIYRRVEVGDPSPELDQVERKVHEIQGTDAPQRPEDSYYEILEVRCMLDIPGFEHREFSEETGVDEITGLHRPYCVTVDRNSRKVLSLRRNWKPEDTRERPQIPFVAYRFVPGLGFYGLGLLHILGNATTALTGAWRLALDNAMFANFPGFLYALSGNRQKTNEIRVAPGTGHGIDTGGAPIRDAVMDLPYRESGPGLLGLIEHLMQTMQRLGGTADIPVGEGRQDAPVGTTLALIEQATKVLSAVHKRVHAAQAEEFQLLRDEIKGDPASLWREEPKLQQFWNEKKVLVALENCSLTPQADPNTPSHMHRLMKAQMVKMLATGNPMYNQQEVDRYVLSEAGVGDPDRFFMPTQPPQAPPVDPVEMAKVQQKAQESEAKNATKAQELQIRALDTQKKYEDKEKERKLDRDIAVLRLAGELAKNPVADTVVDQQLSQMSPFLSQRPRMSKSNGGPVVARAPPFIRGPLPGLGGSPV